MPRGTFKSNRGWKERKLKALVSRMPDREVFFESMTTLTEQERRDVWFTFGRYVGQGLPLPSAMPLNQKGESTNA